MGGLGGGAPQNFFAILGAKILLENTKKTNKQGGGQNDCQNLARHNCNYNTFSHFPMFIIYFRNLWQDFGRKIYPTFNF